MSVSVHYRVWDATKTVLLDSSHAGEVSLTRAKAPPAASAAPLPIRLGRGFAVQAMEALAASMTQAGEVREVECGPERTAELMQLAIAMRDQQEQAQAQDGHQHGKQHQHHSTCACGPEAAEKMARDADLMALAQQTTVLQVQLVERHEAGRFEREMWEYRPEEREPEAQRQKGDGNKAFASGQWDAAIKHYELALGHIEGLMTSSYWAASSRQDTVRQLESTCLLNLAAALLKTNSRHEDAVRYCSQVIARTPNNIKARFRRAQAYMASSTCDLHLDEALADLTLCLQLASESEPALVDDIKPLLVRVQDRLKRLDHKDRRVYSKMFSQS